MSTTRDNHYVPQWYQRGFLASGLNKLNYLDINPETKVLDDGKVITMNSTSIKTTSQCFYQTDLYTTFFGGDINDEIERILFGQIDDYGARAVRAYICNDPRGWHDNFKKFFTYIDSQKIRTPKGLDWIKAHYSSLDQGDLMEEMQAIKNLHCTLWMEGVREIVSAENSAVKFIISDHPVTVYNHACPPDSKHCAYPNDPSIVLKGTQTVFPLNKDYCLILTNLEYAEDPENEDPLGKRTNPRLVRQSMVRTDAFIRSRSLNDNEVTAINLILKSRSRRYIAAAKEDWLYPEQAPVSDWSGLKSVLLPPENELYQYGGEMYVGYKDGRTYYQDAFGRTLPENKYLKKTRKNEKIGRNYPCGCGSGKKYKKCCIDVPERSRTTWDVLSIRERNLVLYNRVEDILGLNKGKSWDDVRRELSNEIITKIHKLYGSLWPRETDIFSLFPRPDNSLRALYTGMLDPRVVIYFALGSVPYFDEILIQHPFVNPGAVTPEFSPVENPHQHKHQMLKNLLMFFYLQPFVQLGVVNFFPDPCSFDNYLQRQMFDMAKQRRGSQNFNEKEAERFRNLHQEDLARTLRVLPEAQQVRQIVQAMPDITQDEIRELLHYMRNHSKQDPLTLLQDDLLREGGQLMMGSLLPNFEMSLFIAQITGSVILTDSEARWEELKGQLSQGDHDADPWRSDFINLLRSLDFVYSVNPEDSFRSRISGNFSAIRKSLRDLLQMVKQDENSFNAEKGGRIRAELISAHQDTVNGLNNSDPYTFSGKMNFLLPKGGIVNKNVLRLLLKSGSEHHVKSVPIAIFAETLQPNQQFFV